MQNGAVALVVYADDTGSHMAPLTELYWSNGRLVSVHPESSTVEVDVVYCPDCFEVLSEADARIHRGRCPNCVACPLCATTLRAEEGDGKLWSFVCSHCRWDSATVGLKEEHPDHLLLTLAQWETDEPRHEAFATLLQHHTTVADEVDLADDEDDDEEDDDDDDDDPERDAPTTTLAQRFRQPYRSDARYQRELLPTRVPLAAKRSRRSKREVDAGRAGIVYKPKALPLDGDSSSRRGGGWAKKDSSAIDFVPRVSLAAPPVRRRRRPSEVTFRFVLELSNPKVSGGPVDVALALQTDHHHHRDVLAPYTVRRARTIVAETVNLCDDVITLDEAEDTEFDLDDDDDDDSSATNQKRAGPPTPAALLNDLLQSNKNNVLRRDRNAAWLRCEATFFPQGEEDFGLVPLRLRWADAVDDGLDIAVVLALRVDDSGTKHNHDEFYPIQCAYRAFL